MGKKSHKKETTKPRLTRTLSRVRGSGKTNWLGYLKPTVQSEDRVLPEKTSTCTQLYLFL